MKIFLNIPWIVTPNPYDIDDLNEKGAGVYRYRYGYGADADDEHYANYYDDLIEALYDKVDKYRDKCEVKNFDGNSNNQDDDPDPIITINGVPNPDTMKPLLKALSRAMYYAPNLKRLHLGVKASR